MTMRCVKYVIHCILLTLFVFIIIGQAWGLPRVAIRAFEDRTEEGDAPAAAVMDMMVTELDNAGLFNLVEREKLDYVAAEIRLGQSGLMDPATAPAIGKIKGAQYTMTGAITLYYYNEKAESGIVLPSIGSLFGTAAAKTAYVDLDIRVIDNSTGEIIYTAVQRGVATQASREPGLFNSGYNRTYAGILATATRDAVMKHIGGLSKKNWEE